MPINHKTHKPSGVCNMKATGELSLSDYLDNADALLSNPEYAECTVDILDSYGIARIYGTMSEHRFDDLEVFRDLASALQWLNVSLD